MSERKPVQTSEQILEDAWGKVYNQEITELRQSDLLVSTADRITYYFATMICLPKRDMYQNEIYVKAFREVRKLLEEFRDARPS